MKMELSSLNQSKGREKKQACHEISLKNVLPSTKYWMKTEVVLVALSAEFLGLSLVPWREFHY